MLNYPSHYLVFIGPPPALALELLKINSVFDKVDIIARAAPKGSFGACKASVEAALIELHKRLALLSDAAHHSPQRLSIWAYQPAAEQGMLDLIKYFGVVGWINFVPSDFFGKNGATRLFIESKIRHTESLINEVVIQTNNKRKTSPFSLPLKSFSLNELGQLRDGWQNRSSNIDGIRKQIKSLNSIYLKRKTDGFSYVDERDLLFKPAEDGALHGKPHPTGSTIASFISGRFRFGASLFPSFHYDVTLHGRGKSVTLQSCDGTTHSLRSGGSHINIFPNDYLC